jgi:predicted alpha/beta-hydrolase family hydrolase
LRIDGTGRRRLWLGHGAGGGVDAPDLLAARDAAVSGGWQVVRVEQPWRVAGKRVAEPPARLDEAWLACLTALPPLPSVLGGRSAGARVACRTAVLPAAGPVLGVLCLAFPLVSPAGRSRGVELATPQVPVLVVQGGRDSFGVPQPGAGRQVVVLPAGDHAFRARKVDGVSGRDLLAAVRAAVGGWLLSLPATQVLT